MCWFFGYSWVLVLAARGRCLRWLVFLLFLLVFVGFEAVSFVAGLALGRDFSGLALVLALMGAVVLVVLDYYFLRSRNDVAC